MPASSGIGSGEHEVGGEIRETPTAPTANTSMCKKDPLNGRFHRLDPRSLSSGCGAIKSSLRAMMAVNTDRTKVPQMTILPAMRAVRAVFCRSLRQKIVLLAAPRPADFDHGPPEPPRTALKPRRGSLTARGPNPMLRPSNPLKRTSTSGRPNLSKRPRGLNSSYPYPLIGVGVLAECHICGRAHHNAGARYIGSLLRWEMRAGITRNRFA
jgi:hypothetical protein